MDHECFSAPKKSAIIKDAFKLMENKERTETVEEELIDEINKTTASNTTKENNKNKTALSSIDANMILQFIHENLPQSALNKHM